jgi:insertion element IS1 protein InsB
MKEKRKCEENREGKIMKQMLDCPNCKSEEISKNGRTRRDKQNHKCREWSRQFGEDPQWQLKDVEKRALINQLLLERTSFA